jgi:multidrug efflux system membrane fusion protein
MNDGNEPYQSRGDTVNMGNSQDSRRLRGFLAFPLICAILFTTWACSTDSKGQPVAQRMVPVVVGKVTQKDVPLELKTMGTVEAAMTVAVKPLVGGEIVAVHFSEGQDVKKGDLLFTIDQRPFESSVRQAEANLAKTSSQVKQAEANLEKDIAQAKNAAVQVERYRTLMEKDLVAKEQYDQIQTSSASMDATVAADRAALDNAKSAVQADRAALENARLLLSYCSVRSPINGRTGNILVHRGNVVSGNIVNGADAQALTMVNQMSPIYVAFSLPEKFLPDVRKYMAAKKLVVEARLPNDDKTVEQGVLTFVDNAIDKTTGTIQLKGTFPNTGQGLWPGQFVNTTLRLATQPGAITVPEKAIQTGQQGQFVFVVKGDLTVESRPVVVEREIGDEVVAKGLNPGETVVLDGQLQLVPGAKVVIRTPQTNENNGNRRNSGGKPA